MAFSFDQRGFDEQGRRVRRIMDGLARPDPVLDRVGSGLAKMWQDNIDAGPNERWQAGLSRRVQRFGGITLRDSGRMKSSIQGVQTGPNEVTVGSALTVGRGYNLLGLHEFGVDAEVNVRGFTRRARSRDIYKTFASMSELASAGFKVPTRASKSGKYRRVVSPGSANVRPFTRHQFLPRRPTSPFDWDREELLPAADEFVRSQVGDYIVRLKQ